MSIHEETFSVLPENWQNETLYKKWEKLLSFRQEVNIAIEEKRSKKIIGSSLEADVKISLSKNLCLEPLFRFLKQFVFFDYRLKLYGSLFQVESLN